MSTNAAVSAREQMFLSAGYFVDAKKVFVEFFGGDVVEIRNAPPRLTYAVSVIVSVFNMEKYLPVCLESLRIQTFTDFELIVVDDCSTDSSVTIAESFLEPFGGRMKIITLEENTGSGVVPRNVGLDFAHGKYVYFMDHDDLLVDNALETLYNFAETFDADVVYMEKIFLCDEELIPKNFEVAFWASANSFVEEPTLETDNLLERIEAFLGFQFFFPPWTKFVRRSLLVDNEIKFPRMKISEDILWTFKLLCLAKKFLRVPTPLYVNRNHRKSVTRAKRADKQTLQMWTTPLLNGVDLFHEFMSGLEFFDDKPTLRLQVLNSFVMFQNDLICEAAKDLSPEDLCEVFLREFKAAGSSQPALISYLLVMNNLYRNELMK